MFFLGGEFFKRMMRKMIVSTLFVLFFLFLRPLHADERTHAYAPGERVLLWAGNTGPYQNPHETYPFDRLPLCEIGGQHERVWKDLSLGEAVEGLSFALAKKFFIRFGVDVESADICAMQLTTEQVDQLRNMILHTYFYQLSIDDLPIQGFLGMVETDGADVQPKLFTHRTFLFKKNGNQIISVDLEPSKPVPLKSGESIQFTYSVHWSSTSLSFSERFNRYLQESQFEHKVHWFSVINSVVLCIFLCAIVVIILMRTLNNDFAKYAATDAAELESMDRTDESGWKQVHGDVFRRPSHLQSLSVVIGCGLQLVTMVIALLILAMFNSFYTQRGMTALAAILTFVATQVVNGAFGGYVFRLYGGKGWKKAMVVQCIALPLLALILFCNTWIVAYAYRSSLALPVQKLPAFAALFLCGCVPLHVLGTRIGRHRSSKANFPCRIHHLKRPIPPKSRFFLPTMVLSAGLIPFGCVFVEMYFLFQALWSYKFYYVYGFILVVFLLFLCVVTCVSITCVYMLLNAEDYRWAWTSIVSCASTSMYVLLYAAYYLHSTHMTGLLQHVHYIASSIFFGVCISLLSGATAFIGASKFVWLIYKNIKSD